MLNRALGFTADKPNTRGNYHRENTAVAMGSNKILSLVYDSGHDCRRQWPRQLMLLSARLLTTTSERMVRIRDVSPGGARIESAEMPPIGTDVLLKRGSFEAFGTIAWIADNQGGIEFEAELDDEAFEALQQPQGNCAPAPREAIRRPGFGRKTGRHARWSDGSGWIDL